MLSKRKEPKQQRSKLIVWAVMKAAARILENSGYTKLTTNHVAILAGVSIGSLYQYFPNKAAIFASIVEWRLRQNCEQMEKTALGVAGRSLEECIDTLVAKILNLFVRQRKLLRVLFVVGPKMNQNQAIRQANIEFEKFLSNFLLQYRSEIRRDFTESSVPLLVEAVIGIIQRTILHDFERYSLDELQYQITTLVKSYLLVPPATTAASIIHATLANQTNAVMTQINS